MAEAERWSYYHSQNTKNMSNLASTKNVQIPHTKSEISFEGELILCKLCLWCASSVPGNGSINTCPVYKTENILAMPITDNYNKYNTITSRPIGLFMEL
jgi:hypothetical protein